jgi:DNA relaxase NicK
MSGNPPEILNHGFLGFQCAAEYHPYGIKVMWDCDDQARKRHGNRVLLQLCGESLSQFFPSDLSKFLFDLSCEFWFKASRIDLSFDDFEKIIRPEDVNEYANQGSYSGFRKHKFIGGSSRSGTATDEGIYFGSRGKNGGGKFLRCYAKDIESDGETDSIRWEVEFSKEKANEVYFNLAMSESVEDLATKIALFIGGSIEFCERYESGKLDPFGKLAFWEQILHYLGAAVLRSPQKLTEIEDSMEWVEKSVAPSLKKIREAIGSEWYETWLRDQLDKVVLKQRALGEIFYYHIISGEPAPF